MLGVARATLGEAWAQARAKLKKTELAEVMEEAFAGGDAAAAGVPAEARGPAQFWVMPGFQAYDNRGLDDNDGDADNESDIAGDAVADGDTVEAAPAAAPAPEVGGDSEQEAPDKTDPPVEPVNTPEAAERSGDTDPDTQQRPKSIVESIDSPAVAERLAASRAAALDALNAVPTADGGPRVIVNTSGFGDDASVDDGSGGATPSAGTASGEPAGGNGHDSGANLLEIPAFLRRS